MAGAERSRPSKSLAKRPPVCYAHAHMGTLYYGDNLGSVMRAFMEFLGPNAMMAYLAMMAPRLVELRHALKPTGSL